MSLHICQEMNHLRKDTARSVKGQHSLFSSFHSLSPSPSFPRDTAN